MTLAHAVKDIRYHDEIAAEYDRTVVEPRASTNDLVYRKIARVVRGGEWLLDLGCGTGHLTSRIGDRFHKVMAVDHSAGMLQQAAANLASLGMKHVDFRQQDALEFLQAAPSGQFDVVGCVGFLHHLQAPVIVRALSDIHRILKDRGYAIFQEPINLPAGSLPKPIERWNSKSVVVGMVYCHTESPPDERPLDRELFASWLSETGFRVRFVNRNWEIFPHHLPPSLVDRTVIRLMNMRYGGIGNVFSVVVDKRS